MNTDLHRLPPRIKYYLLDWKDRYPELYHEMYGDLRLKELDTKQLMSLFVYVTAHDISHSFNN